MSRTSAKGSKRKRIKTVKIPLKDWIFVDRYAGDELTLYEAMHEIMTNYRDLQEQYGDESDLVPYEEQIESTR